MYSKHLFFVGLILVLVTVGQCQVNPLPPWTNEKRDLIWDFLTETYKCRRIPGVSFALVYDGQVRMTEGHGLDNVEENLPADENSRYCIGSLSKAFTATLIGILLDESNGQYTWDTRVKDIMGDDFWFFEAVRSERATLRDLLAHKMGLTTFGGIWAMGLPEGPSRQEYCERLRFLPPAPSTDFRQHMIYNNFMYLLSSCVAEKLGGQPFERLVEEKILNKLGMDNSIYLDSISESQPVPAQYVWNYKTGQLDRLDDGLVTETVPPAEGSGGVCSPAVDMAKWLLMQLGEGVDDVIDEATWRETHARQMSSGGGMHHKKPQYPESWEENNYGFGFYTGDYRGYHKVSHTGQVGAFSSILTLYPDIRLGIFANVNGPLYPSSNSFLQALHAYVTDIVMEEEPWLNVTSAGNVTSGTACTYPSPWHDGPSLPVDDEVLAARSTTVRKAEEDFEQYVGVYTHHLLGDVDVYYNDTAGEMWSTTGRIAIARLIPTADEKIFDIELQEKLEYLTDLGPALPPIVFSDLEGDHYQEVIVHAIDPGVPPVYVRGLDWDDLPPAPEYPDGCTGDGSTLTSGGLASVVTASIIYTAYRLYDSVGPMT